MMDPLKPCPKCGKDVQAAAVLDAAETLKP
jgi:hypothetical protein